MKLSEIVERVITLATTLDEVEHDRKNPNRELRPIPMSELAKLPDKAAAERKELRDFVAGLPPATIYTLVLLMDIGRGWFDTADLLESYIDVSDQYPTPASAAKYLLSKPTDQDLTEGLQCLLEDKIDVDRLLES